MKKARRCKTCKQPKPIEDFRLIKVGKKPYNRSRVCRECLNAKQREYVKTPEAKARQKEYTKAYHKKHPNVRLWLSSYLSARSRGLVHTIKPKDIHLPETCKYLGVRIDYRCASERGTLRAWNAPSIDRIDPARGYTPDNIQVISDLADRMKSNATIKQLLAFAEGVIRVHGGRTPEAD